MNSSRHVRLGGSPLPRSRLILASTFTSSSTLISGSSTFSSTLRSITPTVPSTSLLLGHEHFYGDFWLYHVTTRTPIAHLDGALTEHDLTLTDCCATRTDTTVSGGSVSGTR